MGFLMHINDRIMHIHDKIGKLEKKGLYFIQRPSTQFSWQVTLYINKTIELGLV